MDGLGILKIEIKCMRVLFLELAFYCELATNLKTRTEEFVFHSCLKNRS